MSNIIYETGNPGDRDTDWFVRDSVASNTSSNDKCVKVIRLWMPADSRYNH